VFNVSGKVEATTDMIFMPTARVNFATASAAIRMRGQTTVRDGVTFSGEGAFYNGVGGSMALHHGLSLGDAALFNQGDLSIRRYNFPQQSGLVSVDRFTNEQQGTWHVRIGGPVPGDQHDLLVVSDGAATLGGSIQVELTGAGGGLFQPQVGDEFTILTALGGVSGTFIANPVTVAQDGTYAWTVLYQPNAVVLRLDTYTPSTCYANCDGSSASPVLNINDFVCFQQRFAAGDSYANCDQSTIAPVLNINDFVCFQQRFAAGCN
jgi:hypothetical protein